MDRRQISERIMEILGARKAYTLAPKRISEHIVQAIERPIQFDSNYRTGSLISYLRERKMLLVVQNEVFGQRIVIDSPEKVHLAIKRGMDFYGLSDGDLINEGLDYHTPKDDKVSINIDRFCQLMEKLRFKMEIHGKKGV